MAGRNPIVAPHESCVGCYRGDTTTAVVFSGEAEYIIAGMSQLAALDLDEAAGTFGIMVQEMGYQPGNVPVGRVYLAMRLCRTCAGKTGARIVEVRAIRAREPVHTYTQPDSGPLGAEEF